MANLCSNALKITGKPEDLNKLLDKICIERNPDMLVTNGFHTNTVSPDVFKKYENNPAYKNVRVTEGNDYATLLFDEVSKYDNFGGTLEGVNLDIDGIELDLLASGEVNLSYITLWEPLDIVEKLAELYPELTFRHYYAEPGCAVYGYAEYENGDLVNDDSPYVSNVTSEEWLLHHAPEDFSNELGLIDDED